MEDKHILITSFNINNIFIIALDSFMRMEELTYITAKTKNIMIVKIDLKQSSILFAKKNLYIIL